MEQLSTDFKRTPAMKTTFRILAYPLFAYQYMRASIGSYLRSNGKNDPRYTWIRDIKDKYAGKRCFVVATGSSLQISDLDAIKNEYSFAMNSCILALDKTEWRPTFYGIQDEYVYEKLEADILAHKELNIIVNDVIASMFNIPETFKVFPYHNLGHKMYRRKGDASLKIMFSKDCYSTIYDAASIVFSILQLACYMGFKEIYLLGCDCNYESSKKHFIEHKSIKYHVYEGTGERLIRIHGEFKKFADSIGVKVINCTHGGMLEVYPRKSLEEVLSRN